MVSHTCGHRWGHLQGLMGAREVVVHVVERDGVGQVLDLLRGLAVSRADEIRQRADAEAFKVYDVLTADTVVKDYVVLCGFAQDKQLAETNEHARRVMETQGATVVTDVDDAVTALGGAASSG